MHPETAAPCLARNLPKENMALENVAYVSSELSMTPSSSVWSTRLLYCPALLLPTADRAQRVPLPCCEHHEVFILQWRAESSAWRSKKPQPLGSRHGTSLEQMLAHPPALPRAP